ncbi:MAG: hypothetical protein L6R39_007402 [Caloplaca ligustica]|nr:MAG: hypothetical protein L6R39_007402 [Caloplaca ligustica]
MAALGSSVINKSGKKFAPKAPIRRPVAATPTQKSTRVSVETLRTSQTPQPEIAPQEANDTVSALQAPDQASSVPPAEPETSHNGGRDEQERLLDEDAVDPLHSHCDLDVNSHQSLEQGGVAVPAITAQSVDSITQASQLDKSTESSGHASQPSIPDVAPQTQDERPPTSSQLSPAEPIAQDTQAKATHGDAPSAKRRKLRPDRRTKPSAQASESPAPERRSSLQVQVPPLSAGISSNASPHLHVLSTARIEGPPTQPPKPSRKSSAKGKGKQRQAVADTGPEANRAKDPSRGVNDTQRNTKIRKQRAKLTASDRQRLQDAAADIVADAVEGTTNRNRGRGGRKAREPTPEEAENEIIAPGTIKMAELCKDTRKGKKSATLKALQERDREELAKKKQRELQQLVEGQEQPDLEASGGQARSGAADGNPMRPAGEGTEPQEDVLREVADTYVDEHGQIRINTDSLRVDRHAQAAAARELNHEEAVVENDFSKPAVNSGTYLKREEKASWPEEMTDEFYEALRTFGTDFGMIGRMLRKSRRAVKLKFNKEEKVAPERINQALLGATIAIDLDDYSRRAGEDIKETEEHERKMEEDRKKIEEDAADELKAKAEQEQMRKEQVEKERAALPDDSSGKENRDANRRRKKERKAGDRRKSRKKANSGGEVA